MAKKILILGASGFIGSYLSAHLTNQGFTVIGTYKGHLRPNLIHLDLLDKNEVNGVLGKINPDVVILLSGTKDVARCEKDPSFAMDLNYQTVRNFVDSCVSNKKNPRLIFFSTDYVFDGLRGSYRTTHLTGARTMYGLSNVIAEKVLQSSGLPCLVLRVSAIMGKTGGFYKWLESKLKQGERVELFENTFFSPTSIGHVCRFVGDEVDKGSERYQIRHLNDGYRMSRYQFGIAVARALGVPESLVVPTVADFNATHFQPDLSLLPEGMSDFRKTETWSEMGEIY
jgi:dTDP-4-dehydrorhamnose reductase